MGETFAQQVQGAAAVVHRGVENFDDPVQQLRLLLRGVAASLDHFFQLLGLGIGQPAQNVLREQSPFAVVAGVGRRVQPAMRVQVLGEVGLERDLLVQVHGSVVSIFVAGLGIGLGQRTQFKVVDGQSVGAAPVGAAVVRPARKKEARR